MQGRREPVVGSHFRTIKVGGDGMWNQKPSRMEREVVSLVKRKCQPGGMSLTPRKRGEVVNESRSIPQRIPIGRFRRRRTLECAGVDARAAIVRRLQAGWVAGRWVAIRGNIPKRLGHSETYDLWSIWKCPYLRIACKGRGLPCVKVNQVGNSGWSISTFV